MYPNKTGVENLLYLAQLKGVIGKREVEEAIQRVGLDPADKRVFGKYSMGMKQRLVIAQAIMEKPDVIMLDEPTNGLDPNQILEVRQLIKDIAIDRTVMLSTHILSEVQATCSSIKMIEHGRVVFSGSTEDFDNYIEPNTLYLEFELPPTMDELLKLSGVKRGEVIDNHAIRLWYDGERDTIKQIMREATSRGWDMIELRREKSSMEAVFAKLSGK